MKRLILILTVVCLLVPASAYAQQAAGAFVNGFTQGFMMGKGMMPPPVYQPQTIPQNTWGTVNTPNGIDLFMIQKTYQGQFFNGAYFGANGITTFQGSKY